MEQDVLEIWIAVMTMGAPPTGAQIHFHIAGTRRVAPDLQNRPAKIRTTFKIDETGMKNPDCFSIQRSQFVPPQPLVLPDGLNEPFGWEWLVAQRVFFMGAHAPLSIKIIGQ